LNGDVDSLDIDVVAPLLLSLSAIIQESNKVLNPNKKIGINIKPAEKGSFIIEMALFAKTNTGELLSLINSKNVAELKNLLEWIGIIVGGGSGLLGLIKWLKGKPIEKTEAINKQTTNVFNAAGDNISINSNVVNLYNNQVIKDHIIYVFGNPLEEENITSITTYIKDEQKETEIVTDKTIINDIKEYASSEIKVHEKGDKEIFEEVYMSPKRGSFSGESNEWSFYRTVNGDIIKVNKVSDTDFLNKCKLGEIRPFERDMLKVQLKMIFNQETNKLKKTELVKVLEYVKYEDKQMDLYNSFPMDE
jgi:hypothetical protein